VSKEREKQLAAIKVLKKKIKDHDIVREMFKKYKVDIDELDLVPMAFIDLDVSARTDHGIIYLSDKLLEDDQPLNDDHYLVHELTHMLQQTTGDQPTTGGESGDDYVSNKYEVEGFQNQTEYISDEYGDETAETYVDKVLDHHKLKGKKREERKDVLLQLASENKHAL